ncbi:hypothetical protein K1T71_004918 [Dendrolimus kikuchii]|uniref:Uncharacterized protein n=1 Tax=Dendrolimus kikuchii TaxID=765133 RepID=A0ACC1D5J0_9NEOP|nr:hypothetical protein K1T71_004918 [Dendrolimus kikuchii]
MSCMEASKVDSEMEEGEIVDDLDDLSDISSEEEYLLLRKRLQVLEKYNNVLERTKAKRSSIGTGVKSKTLHNHLVDLSEVSEHKLEEINFRQKNSKYAKSHHKTKRRKEQETNNNVGKYKDKRKGSKNKRKLEIKIISETSEESEDEYRHKRWKLANAVNVKKENSDKSSLSARLKKMLSRADDQDLTKNTSDNNYLKDKFEDTLSPISDDPVITTVLHDQAIKPLINTDPQICELIDISDDDIKIIDDDIKVVENEDRKDTTNASITTKDVIHSNKNSDKDSDEDLELLREYALKTKATKKQVETELKNVKENKILSEEEDSDTAELRLICLKSARLKKAIERKQKQKLIKRLSQSNLQDELFQEQNMFLDQIELDNNTDIESVDMDIVSDGDEKGKEVKDCVKDCNMDQVETTENKEAQENFNENVPNEDELDEDEDVLRAKLLTSLTKNLPNLMTPMVNSAEEITTTKKSAPTIKVNEVPQKRFIINVGESDSEGEHEATKNLTKMHIKLSNQNDFQERLDMFLKSTRMEVEKTKLPDVVQDPAPKKFIAKAVNHLPKSEQIEYKNLVKRMAELEKIKQARQSSINLGNRTVGVKDTLKPRNVAVETKLNAVNNLEDQIALSRKKIAEESAKMLKLKEEGTKLSQKYKIVANELWNITTAITLNKKQQRALQNSLTKIRLHHQSLLKSSTITKHSIVNGHVPHLSQMNKIPTNKLQKENDPTKEDYKNQQIHKNIKVSVANDLKNETNTVNRLSIQVDVAHNKKVIKLPKSPPKGRIVDIQFGKENSNTNNNEDTNKSIVENSDASHPIVEKGGGNDPSKRIVEFIDDYRSPLEALGSTNWEADPNAILCPFEVGGDCKDPDCKYLHTNLTTKQ